MKLYDHQKAGVQAVLEGLQRHKAFLLCDDAGLGKTIQALSVVQALNLKEPTLVVAPPQCIHIWSQGDAVKYFGNYFRIVAYIGAEGASAVNLTKGNNLIVTSYETLLSLYRGYICDKMDVGLLTNNEMLRLCYIHNVDVKRWEHLSGDNLRRELITATRTLPYKKTGNMNRSAANKLLGVQWGLIICDEVHKIKNGGGALCEAVAFLQSNYRLGLTGTPMMNSADDLLSIMRYGLCMFHVTRETIYNYRHLMLRRTKEDVSEQLALPKRQKHDELQLLNWIDDIQKAEYIRVKQASLVAFDAIESAASTTERKQLTMSFMAMVQKLRQICIAVNIAPQYRYDWHPVTHNSFHPWIRIRVLMILQYKAFPQDLRYLIARYFVRAASQMVQPSPKMLQIYNLLKKHEKIVVFSSFRAVIEDVIQPWLEDIGVQSVLFAGGSRKEQEAAAAEFERNRQCRVLLVIKSAGGVGQNFQYASNVCVILDPHFNEALDEQVASRVHRVGQAKEEVIIRKYLMRGSIDEAMRNMQVAKSEDIAAWMSGKKTAGYKMQGLFLNKYDTVK